MKKVLIVTPNWPPVSCPDLHRVRMALPFFAEFGWEPLILKINPDEQEGIKDPELCRTVPESTRTWQAGCFPLWSTGWLGLRNVGLRSFFHLARLGSSIIQKEKPEVVFFSTTMFPLMTLGRHWRWRHSVPYVLDYQDPWVKEKQKAATFSNSSPPTFNFQLSTHGLAQRSALAARSFKRRLADLVAAILEPIALRSVAHIVSVSPAYVTQLLSRYSWLGEKHFTVLPFGAAELDYALLKTSPVRQQIFDPRDGKQHWVYVGVCIPQMAFVLRSFFRALKRTVDAQPNLRDTLRLHFIGTNYAPRDRAVKTVEPIAIETGLGDIVEETTDRIPYFEALQCLLDADALIVPGSDDPGYTASKLFPYILARKPLLAIFHEQSPVVDILEADKSRDSGEFPFRRVN